MFCKKCGHKRTGNEKFCPVCGTQFSIDKGSVASSAISTGNAKHLEENAQLHFCKKCGTKQAPGQKFCPVCGEPYLDENGKAYTRGIKKTVEEARSSIKSAASEAFGKGLHSSAMLASSMKAASDHVSEAIKAKMGDLVPKEITTDNSKALVSQKKTDVVPSASGNIARPHVASYKVCPKCGKKVSVQFKFCPFCASSLDSVAVTNVEHPVANKVQKCSSGLIVFKHNFSNFMLNTIIILRNGVEIRRMRKGETFKVIVNEPTDFGMKFNHSPFVTKKFHVEPNEKKIILFHNQGGRYDGLKITEHLVERDGKKVVNDKDDGKKMPKWAKVGLGIGATLLAGAIGAELGDLDLGDDSSDLSDAGDFGNDNNFDLDGDGQVDSLAVDTNGDGQYDAIGVDTDGDGVRDVMGVDLDGDGDIDDIAVDTDHDGSLDTIIENQHTEPSVSEQDINGDGVTDFYGIDENGDGRFDTAYMDSNYDGIIDGKGVDTDGDGKADTFISDSDEDGNPDRTFS